MGQGSGSQQGFYSYLGVAKEAAFGTRVTATAFFEFTSEGFQRSDKETVIESMVGHRDFVRRVLGNTEASGSLEAPLNTASDAIMLMIGNAIGGSITSATATVANAFSHTFIPGDMVDGEVPSLSFVKRLGSGNTLQFSYIGARTNSLSIKGEQGEPVMISGEFICKDGSATADSLTSAIPDVNPITFVGANYYVAATTTSLFTTTSLEPIQSFELTLGNNLVSDTPARSLGSRTLDVLPPGRRDVKLKVSQRFDTTTAVLASRANTPYAIGILLDSGQTITSGAGSPTYKVEITLPRAYVNTTEPAVGDMGILSQEIEYSCIRATSTSNVIDVVAYNGTASY